MGSSPASCLYITPRSGSCMHDVLSAGVKVTDTLGPVVVVIGEGAPVVPVVVVVVGVGTTVVPVVVFPVVVVVVGAGVPVVPVIQ